MNKSISQLLIFICFCHIASGQKNELPNSLNLGFDIASPIGKLIAPGWTNFEMSITAGSFKNILFTVEAGLMDFSMSKKDSVKGYNYIAKGNYFKFGPDYNLFKRNLPGEQNLVYFGLRYGFSKTSFHADNILIQDTIWTPRTASLTEKTISAHWIEFAAGIKVQFYKHFAMGWSARYKLLISPRKGTDNPYYISGYGKGSENKSFGFTYSLYFTLPLNSGSRNILNER